MRLEFVGACVVSLAGIFSILGRGHGREGGKEGGREGGREGGAAQKGHRSVKAIPPV